MNLFISYASEQHDIAEKLAIALTNEGHDVFFDGDDLRAGDNYNERLRQAIEDCEQFIYLISPESVEDRSYARSELHMAQNRFKVAKGCILPVMVVATDYPAIPNYAKSVTVLEPEGDAVVAILNRVAEIDKGRLRIAGLKTVFGAALVLAVFGTGLYETYLWAWPRMAVSGVIVAVIAAGLVLTAGCWILWRRCVVRGDAKRLAIPAVVLGVLVVGVWLALAFTPRVVWLVPGTSWVPLMANSGSQYSLVLSNPSSQFDNVGTSGVYLTSDARAAAMIIQRSSDATRSILAAYLEERQVPVEFHETYLSGWTAGIRIEDHSGHALASPEGWETSIRTASDGEKATSLNWRHSASISIAFVELTP